MDNVDRSVQRQMVLRMQLDDKAYQPLRAHMEDAGLDLRAPEAFVLKAHSFAVVDTGVHVLIERGWYGKLESKSGLNVNHGIVCPGGVIDSGYTGSIKANLYNFSDEDYEFQAGDKMVQLVIVPCATPLIQVVQELDGTDRGDDGFGSSGR